MRTDYLKITTPDVQLTEYELHDLFLTDAGWHNINKPINFCLPHIYIHILATQARRRTGKWRYGETRYWFLFREAKSPPVQDTAVDYSMEKVGFLR